MFCFCLALLCFDVLVWFCFVCLFLFSVMLEVKWFVNTTAFWLYHFTPNPKVFYFFFWGGGGGLFVFFFSFVSVMLEVKWFVNAAVFWLYHFTPNPKEQNQACFLFVFLIFGFVLLLFFSVMLEVKWFGAAVAFWLYPFFCLYFQNKIQQTKIWHCQKTSQVKAKSQKYNFCICSFCDAILNGL